MKRAALSAKRKVNICRSVKRVDHIHISEREARSATTTRSRALGALILASEVRDENVRAKRADFFLLGTSILKIIRNKVIPCQINILVANFN